MYQFALEILLFILQLCVQNPQRKEVWVHDLFETAGSQVPVSVRSLNCNVRAPGACI